MSSNQKILIYVLGCFAFSILGGVLLSNKIEAGGLIFIIGPLLFSLIMLFQKSNKSGFSILKFNINRNGLSYLFSVLIFPLTLLFTVGLGYMFFDTNIHLDKLSIFSQTILIQFIPRMVFAFFEEIGWRGFLEQEFKSKGLTTYKRHFIIGIIWAIWHLPFILSTPYTTIPLYIFIPMFFIGVILLSFIYGYLLQKTNSIWCGVLFHGISNTLAWAIIDSHFVTIQNPIIANISPESVLGILFFGILAFILFRNKALN